MKNSRRFILFLIISILISIYIFLKHKSEFNAYAHRALFFSFCDKPITYRIGNIDPNYDITEEELLIVANEAANIWNSNYSKILFKYDENAKLKINLHYDDRQQLITSINQEQAELDKNEEEIQKELNKFEQFQQELQNKLNKLNRDIEEWNKKRNGAVEEYEELNNRIESLQKEIEYYNSKAEELNQSAQKFNNKVLEINNQVESFNKLISNTPEKGLYIPTTNDINIYVFKNRDSLLQTIAHEFGHALGLDHGKNENSLMYPISNDVNNLSNEDINLLNQHCSEKSRLKIIINDLKNIINNYDRLFVNS